MKNATTYAKKLASLLRRIKIKESAEPTAPLDPISCLVHAFLQWNSTTKSAASAYQRLMTALVDHNDLRVTHAVEMAELLGPRYPLAAERAARLRDTLQEIFRREHATSLDHLKGKPKKEIRAYLESLPGMTSYVSASVFLRIFEGHALPVDDRLAEHLKHEGIVDPQATLLEIEMFLERNIRAEDALDCHLALQAWADQAPAHEPAARPAAARPTPKAAPSKSAASKRPAASSGRKSTKPSRKASK
ncbi:MAG: hypothetical protein IT443_00660 [Phycisphaeraceae bacterium]|nr:hypothetical protein [Phycisphaeraceae bacterium]